MILPRKINVKIIFAFYFEFNPTVIGLVTVTTVTID